jgi:dihydroorotate dehydrogenase electron transfer subunit
MEKSKARDYNASIASSRLIAIDTAEILLEIEGKDLDIGPLPGQFAHIEVPGGFLRRPISVAGCDRARGRVRLIVQRSGNGSTALTKLPKGASIRALLPLGQPFPLNLAEDAVKNGGRIWIAAGGIGLAPLLLFAQFARAGGMRFDSFVGFREEGRVFGVEELKACGDVSLELGGLVTDVIEREMERVKPRLIFACGPAAMLKTLQKICDRHEVKAFASLEERMGCGVGACLACACMTARGGFHYKRYERVCADGPSFNLSEVVFD